MLKILNVHLTASRSQISLANTRNAYLIWCIIYLGHISYNTDNCVFQTVAYITTLRTSDYTNCWTEYINDRVEWNVSSYTSFLYCTHYYLIKIPFFFLFIEIIVRLVDLFVPFFSFNHWYCVECSNSLFVYIFNLYSSFKRFISWI
jgi:hypothetical protein